MLLVLLYHKLDFLNKIDIRCKPTIEQLTTNNIRISISPTDISKLSGVLVKTPNGWRLDVDEIYFQGEKSGTFYQEIIKPMLKLSAGKLEAILIWEGGDSIIRLSVEDGKITQVEL